MDKIITEITEKRTYLCIQLGSIGYLCVNIWHSGLIGKGKQIDHESDLIALLNDGLKSAFESQMPDIKRRFDRDGLFCAIAFFAHFESFRWQKRKHIKQTGIFFFEGKENEYIKNYAEWPCIGIEHAVPCSEITRR